MLPAAARIASLLILITLASAPAGADVVWLGEVAYRLDSQDTWRTENFFRLPHSDDIVYIRAAAELPAAFERPIGLRIQALATCEASWDGVDLRAAGRVGRSAEDERPGPLRQVLHVPDRLAAPGSHRLELRCSMHHRGFVPTAGFWTLEVGSFERLTRSDELALAFAMISVSGMLLVGLFALAGWAFDRQGVDSADRAGSDRLDLLQPGRLQSGRRQPGRLRSGRREADLWLAVFCFGAASLAVAESWRLLVDYSYDWHIWRLRLIAGLAWLVAMVLVVYVVRRFPRAGDGRWILGTAAATAACVFFLRSWDGKATSVFLVALPVAAWWCWCAVREGRPGAVAAGLGVLICAVALFWQPLLFIDRNLYVAVDLLLLCLLVGHARENAALRRQREEAKLAAARLEAELLRRQLQPHFLMNTLTALAEWIEEDPPTAVSMIEALAGEMRTLRNISDRRTISLAEELELCRRHLDVMSLRRGVRYRLETEGVDEEASIAPAVLHTLVENAVTHGGAAEGEVVLSLRQETDGARRILTFDAPLGDRSPGAAAGTGAGLRYVTARLRESYGDGARFEAGIDGDVWRSRLQLPAEQAP